MVDFAMIFKWTYNSTARCSFIASGGAGKKEDFFDVFCHKGVDAGLAAGIFHNKELSIRDLKEYLNTSGIEMRL